MGLVNRKIRIGLVDFYTMGPKHIHHIIKVITRIIGQDIYCGFPCIGFLLKSIVKILIQGFTISDRC